MLGPVARERMMRTVIRADARVSDIVPRAQAAASERWMAAWMASERWMAAWMAAFGGRGLGNRQCGGCQHGRDRDEKPPRHAFLPSLPPHAKIQPTSTLGNAIRRHQMFANDAGS